MPITWKENVKKKQVTVLVIKLSQADVMIVLAYDVLLVSMSFFGCDILKVCVCVRWHLHYRCELVNYVQPCSPCPATQLLHDITNHEVIKGQSCCGLRPPTSLIHNVLCFWPSKQKSLTVRGRSARANVGLLSRSLKGAKANWRWRCCSLMRQKKNAMLDFLSSVKVKLMERGWSSWNVLVKGENKI